MIKSELEKFDLKRLFDEYFANYIGWGDIREMFYAKAYLMYLAKKNNINLQKCIAFTEYAEPYKSFSVLLDRLLCIYSEYNDITKEYEILKDIKSLFEKNYTDKINEELDNKLFDVMSKLTEEELKELFKVNSLEFKHYLSKLNFASSKLIVELVGTLLDIKSDDDVLDLCSGNGEFLVSLANKKEIKLTGIEINENSAFISKIRLAVLLDNNAEIVVNDALTYDFDKKFDKIFCEYPLGLRVDNYRSNQLNNKLFYPWNKPGLTSDWMFLNKVVTLLEDNGTAAIIITDGPLFKSMDIDCRKDILVSGVVKCIVKLPNGILPYNNMSANLVILSRDNVKNEIKFIDASQEYTENKQKERLLNVSAIIDLINGTNNDKDKVKTEQTNEICLTKDALLTVNSYVKKKEPNYINPRVLKEFIIDKYRGYQFTSQEQSEIEDINGDYELLTVGDINEGIISDNLLKINSNNNKYDRYLLKNGDVVISSKGTKIKVAVAEVENRKVIPNGNLLVLRLDTQKLDPYYLQAYLNSENGRLSIEQIQTGAVIISINPSRIEQINVSMVDKESQEIFAQKYKRKMTEFILAQEHVKKLKEQLDNLFTNEIEEKQDNE